MAGQLKPVEVELTIISAKDLKNVNWRYGDLRPYAVAWIDRDHKISTQVDVEGDTNPSWNHKLAIPLTKSLQDTELMIDIVHEKASDLTKPLVGTARIALREIMDVVGFGETQARTLKLKRPSSRTQGKLEIAVCVREKQWPEQQYGYPHPYVTRDHHPQGYPLNYTPYPSQQYPYANIPPPTMHPNPYGSPYSQPGSGCYAGSYYEQGPSGYGSTPIYEQPEKSKSSNYGSATIYGQPDKSKSSNYERAPIYGQPEKSKSSNYGSAPIYGQPEKLKSSNHGSAPVYGQPEKLTSSNHGSALIYGQPEKLKSNKFGSAPVYGQPEKLNSSKFESAPVYGHFQKPKSSKFGVGTGLAVGAVAGVLGWLALAEGVDYVEDKIDDETAEKVEDDLGDEGSSEDEGGSEDYEGGDDY